MSEEILSTDATNEALVKLMMERLRGGDPELKAALAEVGVKVKEPKEPLFVEALCGRINKFVMAELDKLDPEERETLAKLKPVLTYEAKIDMKGADPKMSSGNLGSEDGAARTGYIFIDPRGGSWESRVAYLHDRNVRVGPGPVARQTEELYVCVHDGVEIIGYHEGGKYSKKLVEVEDPDGWRLTLREDFEASGENWDRSKNREDLPSEDDTEDVDAD